MTKSRFYNGNAVERVCCDCGRLVEIDDGYNVRGSGYRYRKGAWGTRHGGGYDGLRYVCEPGKLKRLRAEERALAAAVKANSPRTKNEEI